MDSKYFVLEFKGESKWAKAARTAMRTYAWEIEQFDRELSNDIKGAVYMAEREAHVASLEVVSQ